jgi:hypothetical protein
MIWRILSMKIAIGSDKSGFSAKEAIRAYLTEAGVEFDDLGSWISHGYSFYGGYDHYTLDQKKDKYIEEFFDCWPPALDLLPSGVLGCVRFRIGDKEGEDEGFLVRQLDAMERALAESDKRKCKSPKGGEGRDGK